MKKFISSIVVGFIAATACANWNVNDRDAYFQHMFQVTIEYDTYGTFLDTGGTIHAIECIGDYYESKYSYKEWLFFFEYGNQDTLDEYYQVENVCLLEALDLNHTQNNTQDSA